MKRRGVGLVLVGVVVMGLVACGPSSPDPILDPVPAPVTVVLDELGGQTVEVPLESVLNINVGDLEVTSVTATIEDPSVAEFSPGSDDGSAQFNPGVVPLAVGQTLVTLTHESGAFEPVEFTLVVTP